MRLLLLLTASFVLPLAAPASAAPRAAHPTDSIGRQVQGGKTYVKHKVAKGDSFYSIARKYHVPMDQLVAANPKVKNTLSIGQVVLVPRSLAVLTNPAAAPDNTAVAANPAPKRDKPDKPEKSTRVAPSSAAGSASGAQTHTVASGQTLSAIARKYHVSVADLRRWNNLKNDNLRLKQRLVVSAAPAAPRESIVAEAPTVLRNDPPAPKAEESKPEEHKAEEHKTETRTSEADSPRRAPVVIDAADDSTGTEVAESLRKVTENGMAEAIDATSESAKFLALHRTAAVGSLLQVKNPQNGQSVFVRVIGKLPPTGANENVIIRLSRRAVQKLQVVDARFRVEVSYMP